MAVVTISDYNGPTASRPFSRQCPSFSLPWASMTPSYNIRVDSRSLMLRRIAFLAIQLFQFAYLVFYTEFLPKSPFDIPWALTGILFFFFLAWNLHLIVSMEGDRIVLGLRCTRLAFDGFLWGMVAGYGWALVWRMMGGDFYAISTMRVLLNLEIFVVAWISTWPADGGVSLA